VAPIRSLPGELLIDRIIPELRSSLCGEFPDKMRKAEQSVPRAGRWSDSSGVSLIELPRIGAWLSQHDEAREEQARNSGHTPALSDGTSIGDRLTDETGQWDVIGRPYTTVGGKTAHVRVQRAGNPDSTQIRTWGAHERVSVKRVRQRTEGD
jgi:hypothetical protein